MRNDYYFIRYVAYIDHLFTLRTNRNNPFDDDRIDIYLRYPLWRTLFYIFYAIYNAARNYINEINER